MSEAAAPVTARPTFQADDYDSLYEQAADIAWPVFAHHGWMWASSKGAPAVPTHEQIVDGLRDLAEAMSDETSRIESGRFIIQLGRGEDALHAMTISLVVAKGGDPLPLADERTSTGGAAQ